MSEINWPLNPEPGLKFTSDYGRTWIFDGCGWAFTCCEPGPTGCGYSDGITVWVPFGGGFDISVNWGTIFFQYSGMSGAYPVFEPIGNPFTGPSGVYVTFNEVDNQWELFDNELGITAGYGPELYGEWTIIEGEGPTTFTGYVECGGTSFYCISASDDGASGPISYTNNAIIAYENLYDEYPVLLLGGSPEFSSLFVGWIGGPTGWIVGGLSTYHDPVGCEIGVTGGATSIPTGTYSLCDNFEITITNGQCPT